MATPRCSLLVGYRGSWRHPKLQKQLLVQGCSCSILSWVGKPKPVPGHKWREDLGERRANSKGTESIRHHTRCSEAVWVTPQESHAQQMHGRAAWEGQEAMEHPQPRTCSLPRLSSLPSPSHHYMQLVITFSLSERLCRVSMESIRLP